MSSCTIDRNGKREKLNHIRRILNEWEDCVDSIGNEDAYSDRILDDLPDLVSDLTEIIHPGDVKVEGLHKNRLKKIDRNANDVAKRISWELDKEIKKITILSAGWDSLVGNYVVVRAGGRMKWIVTSGNIQRDNGIISERGLA